MIKWYKDKLTNKISNYVKSEYELISKADMKMGDGLFNRSCHRNAVQRIKENKSELVYVVIAINSNNFPVVHFINKDNDGKFVDNTLGWEYEYLDYYIIKQVKEHEFKNISTMLMDTKDILISRCGNKLLVKLFKINNENIGI